MHSKCVDQKKEYKHIGVFFTVTEASQAYQAYVDKLYGNKKDSVVAKIYDTYEAFKSRDDGETDFTPLMKHR